MTTKTRIVNGREYIIYTLLLNLIFIFVIWLFYYSSINDKCEIDPEDQYYSEKCVNYQETLGAFYIANEARPVWKLALVRHRSARGPPKWCPRGLQGEPRGAQSQPKYQLLMIFGRFWPQLPKIEPQSIQKLIKRSTF